MDWDQFPNFSKEEFDCKCCGANEMDAATLEKLQQLRETYGKPIKITSGYRCTKHPVEAARTARGGVGAHTTGKAFDIAVDRKNAWEILQLAMVFDFKGIGVQQKGEGRFLHLDTVEGHDKLPRPTVWSY
jgi:zinc D-Ala-D-Ala carboxypeptidase